MPNKNNLNQKTKSKMAVIDTNRSSQTKYIQPKQSANTLFHFVEKYEWLCDMLKRQLISPRYCEERFDFLDSSLPSLVFPMKCFCDIYLEKLHLHTNTYGSYGLGFSKEWLIMRKLQPVHYINPSSDIGENLRDTFLQYINQYGYVTPNNERYNSFFRKLRYVKPLFGKMARHGQEREFNFHDEQEWRFIPEISANDTLIEPLWYGTYSNQKRIQLSSEAISNKEQYGIPFSHEELKYIILPTYEDSMKISQFIYHKLNLKLAEKLALISKILVFDIAEGDWLYGVGSKSKVK